MLFDVPPDSSFVVGMFPVSHPGATARYDLQALLYLQTNEHAHKRACFRIANYKRTSTVVFMIF